MATTRISPGDILECRVARLRAAQGDFVRRRVDLNRFFHPEKLQITDIDVLVYEFGSGLSLRRHIGECKSGSGKSAPKTVDRILWLSGLRGLTQAESGFLFTASPASPRLRELGQELNVEVYDLSDLARLEAAYGIQENSAWGAHDPQLVPLEDQVRKTVRSDREVERAYWFLRADFWHLDPVSAVKRVLAVVQMLSKRWVEGLSDEEDAAVSWLIADSLTAFSVACVTLARRAILSPESEFEARLKYALSGGATSPDELQRLSHQIDRFIMSVLSRANVPSTAAAEAMGAFAPQPPRYATSLCEVLVRLAARASVARVLPSVMEEVVTHAFRLRRNGLPSPPPALSSEFEGAMALVRLLGSFLNGNVDISDRAVSSLRGESPHGVVPTELSLDLGSPEPVAPEKPAGRE